MQTKGAYLCDECFTQNGWNKNRIKNICLKCNEEELSKYNIRNGESECSYCNCDCKFCRNVRSQLSFKDWKHVFDYLCSVYGH